MNVVSDASPIITLAVIERLDLLRTLYERVLIPQAVEQEVFGAAGLERPAWIEVAQLALPVPAKVLARGLGMGETEAIALTIERFPSLLLLDDLEARRFARSLDIRFAGLIGVLLEARRRGEIEAVVPILDQMIANGFRVSESLREQVQDLES